jgi:probable HAF family extracellular repeat protein
MSPRKTSALATFAAACLLVASSGWAQVCASSNYCAAEWTNIGAPTGTRFISLGGLPGVTSSAALGINNAGQAVGYSVVGGLQYATEWSGGDVIDLGLLPGATSSAALGINKAGLTVGYNIIGGVSYATEWSGGVAGSIINLGPGQALGINAAGQAVGWSVVDGVQSATEWSDGKVIDLGPGVANGINGSGQVVGYSHYGDVQYATEWSDGSVLNLRGLTGSTSSAALGINDAGLTVGYSIVGGNSYATEWSGIGGSIINLGGQEKADQIQAAAINDAGQVVGVEYHGFPVATLWSGGRISSIGGNGLEFPASTPYGFALGINGIGDVVGDNLVIRVRRTLGAPGPPTATPEPSTWAMMLLGFAGLALTGLKPGRHR